MSTPPRLRVNHDFIRKHAMHRKLLTTLRSNTGGGVPVQQAPAFSLLGRLWKLSYEPLVEGKWLGAISLGEGAGVKMKGTRK